MLVGLLPSLPVLREAPEVLHGVTQMRQDPREAWLIAQKWPSTAPVQPHPGGKEPRDFMSPTVAEVAAVYKYVVLTASSFLDLSACSYDADINQQACMGCNMPPPPNQVSCWL